MIRLTLSTQKGGVGKTALAVNLARYFVDKHKKVLVIDLDVQGNASDSLSDCKKVCSSFDLMTKSVSILDALLPTIESNNDNICFTSGDGALADLKESNIEAYVKQLEANLNGFEELFDVLIIDTPPTLGPIQVLSLLISQKVLIPIEVEFSSLSGAVNIATTIENLKKINSDLDILGIVVNKMQAKPRLKSNLIEIQNHPIIGQLLLPTLIYNRDSIAQATAEHKHLRDLNKSAAKKALAEVNALGDYITKKYK